MSKQELFNNKLLAYFLKELGAFPIDRGNNDLKAVKMACDMADGGLVCVCGSLYLAGDVRKIINNGGLING